MTLCRSACTSCTAIALHPLVDLEAPDKGLHCTGSQHDQLAATVCTHYSRAMFCTVQEPQCSVWCCVMRADRANARALMPHTDTNVCKQLMTGCVTCSACPSHGAMLSMLCCSGYMLQLICSYQAVMQATSPTHMLSKMHRMSEATCR